MQQPNKTEFDAPGAITVVVPALLTASDDRVYTVVPIFPELKLGVLPGQHEAGNKKWLEQAAIKATFPEQIKRENRKTEYPTNIEVLKTYGAQPNHVGQGFGETWMRAYQDHFGLVIDAGDLWSVVCLRFAALVNAHPAAFKYLFVDTPEGAPKQRIELRFNSNEQSIWDPFFANVVSVMQKKMVDPRFAEDLLPSFSTTTTEDRAIAAAILMATTKEYFEFYASMSMCGVPYVAFRGTVADFEILAIKVRLLSAYLSEVPEAEVFCANLTGMVPIIGQFINTMEGRVERHWWASMVDTKRLAYGSGSGPLGKGPFGGWLGIVADAKTIADLKFETFSVPIVLRDERGPRNTWSQANCVAAGGFESGATVSFAGINATVLRPLLRMNVALDNNSWVADS